MPLTWSKSAVTRLLTGHSEQMIVFPDGQCGRLLSIERVDNSGCRFNVYVRIGQGIETVRVHTN
jgi:hypothetical protein